MSEQHLEEKELTDIHSKGKDPDTPADGPACDDKDKIYDPEDKPDKDAEYRDAM